MKYGCSSMFSCIFFLLFSFSFASDPAIDKFLRCLSHNSSNSTIIEHVYTPNNQAYFSILDLQIRNPRFSSPSTPKPLVIIKPTQASHVQKAIKCIRTQGLQVRVRSGGHDYEAISYVSHVPFVVIDLISLKSISINVEKRTAWVQAGATIGELYYKISNQTRNLGFPAGVCHTVGVGGHFSGGGYGSLLRKYGLAADNIIDAKIVDVESRILDRKSMGKDLFWAIRGGGGASFGVILAWKIRLLPIPSIVTVFTVSKNLDKKGMEILHHWQHIAHKFHEDLFIRINIQSTQEGKRKILEASFISLFLGGVDRLLPLMEKSFPELGLSKEDCIEMSWVESILYFAFFESGKSMEILLDRAFQYSKMPYKGKSDYVKKPISIKGLEGMVEMLNEEDIGMPFIQFNPFGGRMNEILESEIPFPHRANIYQIQYYTRWKEEGNVTKSQVHIDWIRRLYSYMATYVSKNPREAYINYRDLDIGTNGNNGTTSYAQARIWGLKYFRNNFDRLVRVKTLVDPTNFFRDEQSIPPLPSL
ncbi:hypothetical protein UlMin_038603 [Ulmus minor]